MFRVWEGIKDSMHTCVCVYMCTFVRANIVSPFFFFNLQAGDLTSDPTSLLATSCLCRQYRVCVDKGTYDAISLNPDGAERSRMAYRQMVKHLLQPGGLLMITSCNWTKDELLDFFKTGLLLPGLLVFITSNLSPGIFCLQIEGENKNILF